MLRGRRSECQALDRLLEAVRGGRSGALVLRGEAGIGKTALLEYAIESASDLRVVRAVVVESEMELAFAGLHQLCAPMLDRIDRLPGPQHDALGIAFGLRAGAVPDRFFVGLAVLSLLSEVAEERPLVCVVDDAQWLDRVSAQTLGFVARRLLAESVLVLFAVRESGEELRGLPELEVRGLHVEDARELLGSVIRGPLDERVRERIVAETRGNPLALLELSSGLSSAQLAGGFGLPGGRSLPGRIEESFQRRLGDLPEDTQRLLLVAAAEPVGDAALLWAAAQRLGIMAEALAPAQSAGLLEVGTQVRFRHPLVRSAVYRSASLPERRAVHLALTDVTDRQLDPDRRAWHLAAAAPGPMKRSRPNSRCSAGRAQARGGVAAAAAFLQRSAALTVESGAPRCACARGRSGECSGRRVRHGSRAAGHGGGWATGPARARAGRPGAWAGCVRLQRGRRGAGAALEGGKADRAAGCRARAPDLSGGVGRRVVRRAVGAAPAK